MGHVSISLVVPTYNEEECIGTFLDEVTKVLKATGECFEILVVDDGSSDSTVSQVRSRQEMEPYLKVCEFSYNQGKPLALTAGIFLAKGDVILLMDPDLQDPPEQIPNFLAKIREGHDLVFGVRREKVDTVVNKIFSKLFWWSLEVFTGLKIPKNLAVMRAFNRRFAEQFKKYPEANRFIEGIFLKIGMNQATIEIENRPRFAGQSKFTFRKKVDLAVNAILSYSDLPLRFTVRFGLILISLSLIVALALAYLRLFVMKFQMGWPSLIVVNLMGFGFVIFFLGIIGSYIGAIYQESKRRPLFSLKNEFKNED